MSEWVLLAEKLQLRRLRTGWHQSYYYHSFCDRRDYRIRGYLFVSNSHMIICFLGSKSMGDVRDDLQCCLTRVPDLPGKFHSGFYRSYLACRDDLYQKIERHHHCPKRPSHYPSQMARIDLIGHSLGCGPAVLWSIHFSQLCPGLNLRQIHLTLFCSPRMSNPEFNTW